MPHALSLTTIDGLPAHPLLVDAVAVLLPLAALCSVAVAVHGGLRRRFGAPVLALTLLAVTAVPLAQQTGHELRAQLLARGQDTALADQHAALGAQLLPYALGFGVAVAVLFIAGKLADRERTAAAKTTDAARAVPRTWRRIAVLAAVLVAGMAVLTTVEVVRIGTSGAQAVWHQLG